MGKRPVPPTVFFGDPLGSVRGSSLDVVGPRGLWSLPQLLISTVVTPQIVAGLAPPSVSASATVSAPLSATLFLPPWQDSSLSIGDSVEQMDASISSVGDASSQVGDDQSLHSASSTGSDLRSYDHILSVVLDDLGKSQLLVRDVPKPCSFWEWDPRFSSKQAVGPSLLF